MNYADIRPMGGCGQRARRPGVPVCLRLHPLPARSCFNPEAWDFSSTASPSPRPRPDQGRARRSPPPYIKGLSLLGGRALPPRQPDAPCWPLLRRTRERARLPGKGLSGATPAIPWTGSCGSPAVPGARPPTRCSPCPRRAGGWGICGGSEGLVLALSGQRQPAHYRRAQVPGRPASGAMGLEP